MRESAGGPKGGPVFEIDEMRSKYGALKDIESTTRSTYSTTESF